MNRPLSRFTLLAAAILLSACSATGPLFSAAPAPAAADALVYVYRPEAPFYGGIKSHFYVDGAKVASLSKGGYSAFYLPVGSHTMKQQWTGMTGASDTLQFGFELKPGETRYYRLSIGLESFGPSFGNGRVGFAATHRWALTQVPEAAALPGIALTHFEPPADATSAARIGSK